MTESARLNWTAELTAFNWETVLVDDSINLGWYADLPLEPTQGFWWD